MAHVINLISIAMLDGKITEEEKKLILKISNNMGLTDEEFETCVKTANATKGQIVYEPPTSDQEKAAFLKNMVLMMMIDGECSDSELRYIKVLAEKFGYDGEKTINILVDKINEEFTQITEQYQQEPKNNPNVNPAASDKEQIRKMVAKGKEALLRHDIREAFNQLFIPAHLDAEAQRLFLSIPRIPQRMHQISQSQIDVVKGYSDKGYHLSQYVYARYLQLYKPEENSLEEARNLLEGVWKAGLGDASCLLAEMLLYGNFGLVDLELYQKMVKEAMDKGSNFANCKRLSEMIHGEHGIQADPGKVSELIKDFLNGDESDDPGVVTPQYYELLGEAYQEIGDKKQAEHYYRKAINMGHYEAYSNYCLLMGCNDEGEVIDQKAYDQILKDGCDHKDSECLLIRGDFPEEKFEALMPITQKIKHESIEKDLKTAFELGNGYAAYLIARNYYYGYNGFEENDDEAWGWLVRGSRMESAECYAMMADMVMDGHAPNGFDAGDDFVEYCQMSALRRGDDSQLMAVVKAYKTGKLAPFAKEIEKYYIPKYDRLSDEEKATYFGMSFVAVMSPSKKADIIEFDFERNTWEELCEIIDAKKLNPFRMESWNQITKDVDLDDKIIAWSDSTNNSENRYFILTLEDEEGNPRCFDDIYQLEEIIERMGYEIEKIYYDEFPDDDGRWDAYA